MYLDPQYSLLAWTVFSNLLELFHRWDRDELMSLLEAERKEVAALRAQAADFAADR